MSEWFEEWFGEAYLRLSPHRDEAEAERAVALLVGITGLQPRWRVLDVACGAGRHTRAFRSAGARCVGVDLSAALLRVARTVTDAPLVRADMRALPIRPESLDLTVNLFTSFGYFAPEAEHVTVRARLVPCERLALQGRDVEVTRSLSPDGHYVSKTIFTEGRRYVERV